MFFISDIYTKSTIKFDTPLQKEVYKILQKLDIDFERVDTDEAITMEDCVQINKKLNMKMVI
ncbi:proline--tRNA ligase [Clostridioides difficile]|uniref:proline--tRNA ligase n=1 Tax=Clostridioides difficile TaxID=1496 RepID=UPI00093E5DE8|nr:proline--tRNA ligase [Clostridioides difficile]MDV9234327.1 proline--tRNA ligase [Clostridioides difficile]OYO89648.1 proline--tRNA ligase [Clostridioides difficile]HCQ5599607.1 proline--tRNA ligase [Clostridioides difficile]HCQ6188267.1 proline--tRNA ligase [Clostridioides difficile]